jgi:hypothetical protein
MKTDRTRDLLKYMVKRAIANDLPLSAVTDGLKPELLDRAHRLYAELSAKKGVSHE